MGKHRGRHAARLTTTHLQASNTRLLAVREDADNMTAPGSASSLQPPKPPLPRTPLTACDPDTPLSALWAIAREQPELRRYIIANPSATPDLLEYIAQSGGPGVTHCMRILLDSLESKAHDLSSRTAA
ncbi:hypothetical protein [Bifidobacterium aquikefiricola]|uniref:Leucine rich repeat variant domain-containing protein n=1 Tax=Bifidobacterium aquikefiricola TaxID=3059038 RepID=A0AB39U6G9_9BIFI